MSIIYRITNKNNDKSYIGKTKYTVEMRWKSHLYLTKKGSNYLFHRAIRKHGENIWNLEILERPPLEKLNEREEYWIRYYDTFNSKKGYNSTSGGEGNLRSEEMRTKQSLKMKGRYAGNKNPMYGIPSPMTGKKHTEEWKKAASERTKGDKNPMYGAYGNKNPMYGIPKELSPNYGRFWVTNGIENKKLKKDDPIPEGWRKGRFTPWVT